MCTVGTNVAQLSQVVAKVTRSSAWRSKRGLSKIWGEELWSLEKKNTSDFEREITIGKAMNSAPAMEENDKMHEKMMEFEPVLETSGERNLRSINLTHW